MIKLRDAEQVQRAHDILVSVMLRDVDLGLNEHDRPLAQAALDALCWVLCHDDNRDFQLNLDKMESEIKLRGIEEYRKV